MNERDFNLHEYYLNPPPIDLESLQTALTVWFVDIFMLLSYCLFLSYGASL